MDAGPDAQIPCIEIPLDGGLIEIPLETEVQLGRADVVLAIDTTASMGQEIGEIRRTLRDQIVPGIRSAIPDANLGVTTYADFPEGGCGSSGDNDLPFRLVLPVTEDVGRVQSAVDSVRLNNGADTPESQVEALYQIATGEGVGRYVPASFGCPMGGFGYPCFRTDALPVVLLFSDAPFHNGPGGGSPYSDSMACPAVATVAHDYDDAVEALQRNEIRVIGLYSGPPRDRGLPDMRQLALDTNALGDGDEPLVFDIGENGERLSTSVIDAITTLAEVIELDIDTVLMDVDRTDAVDPRDFVEAVVPLRADPMDGVREIDVAAGAFLGVRTGTTVVFGLTLRNDAVAPGAGPQRFLLEVVFRGDGRTRIGSVIIEIVVPGADGTGCEEMTGTVLEIRGPSD
ncbi:vWA domain-containing protein [Sandaracinus amylolyticus]|uniref:vWA domain-containing protein n=1 Tax=Sandaracinus amylolyticus TaxID=927083 RepID=UPI001F305C5E|nr:vWA domain-containing protein [Sandaracinus amylolyticus]